MAYFSFKKGYLEKRIEYLEEVNRKIQSSLDAIKGLSDFQQKIGNKYNLDVIFNESRNRILDFINFKVVDFLLYDLQTYDFKLAHIYPEFLKSDLTMEIDNQIESGNFAWAISQKKSVFVQPTVLEPHFDLILHTLMTESAVMGMFIGQIGEKKENIYDESFELLSIALQTTALAVENAMLYNEIEDSNKNLEQKVEEKAANIVAMNKKLTEEIKEREATEIKLRQAMADAKAAARSKSEFLANMSHEIRTPLNAILGMCELVLETDLNSEQHEYLEVIQSSSEGLFSLINDILDFSKIEAGKVELETVSFDLRKLIESVVDIFSLSAENKGLELYCDIQPDLPRYVEGDSTRIRQILVNLIANAVKFTAEGHVLIKATCTKKDLKPVNRFSFIVQDTGIGIPDEHQQKIFEKFSQADNTITRQFGGTGLGLSITCSLVNMMGGELHLTSKEADGSTFTVELDLPEVKENTIPNQFIRHNKNKVLVFDNNEINGTIIRNNLEYMGFDIIGVENRAGLLNKIKTSLLEIQTVILDFKSEDIDKITEIAEFLKCNESKNTVTLILLTSKSRLKNIDFSKYNFATFISKPVKQDQLFSILRKSVEREYNSVIKVDELVQKRQIVEEKHILVAEDNAENRKIIGKMLENDSHKVTLVHDGKSAVEAFQNNNFDLVLMDIQMPLMNGFEACQQIRKIERLEKKQQVPVIAFTAHAIKGYKELCLKNDMDDYLTKPIEKQTLLETVDKWLTEKVIVIDQDQKKQSLK